MSQISATNFQASSHECVDVNFTDCASICSTISSNKSLHVRIQGSNPTLKTDLENEKIKHLELDLKEKDFEIKELKAEIEELLDGILDMNNAMNDLKIQLAQKSKKNRCEICDVEYYEQFSLDSHLSGKRHQKKASQKTSQNSLEKISVGNQYEKNLETTQEKESSNCFKSVIKDYEKQFTAEELKEEWSKYKFSAGTMKIGRK